MKKIIFTLGLLLTILALYQQNFNHEFHLDSHYLIEYNKKLATSLPITSFFTDPSTYSSTSSLYDYRPLLALNFYINYQIGGLDMFPWHLIQILLHWLVCLLIYTLCKQFSSFNILGLKSDANRSLPYLVTFIFAVHPLNAGVINYLSARSEMQLTIFLLLAQIIFLTKWKLFWRYLLVSLFYCLALFTKINALALIPLLILLDILKEPNKESLINCLQKSIKKQTMLIVLLLLVSILYFFLRKIFLGEYILYGPHEDPRQTGYIYFINQISILLRYITRIFFPLGLSTDYYGTIIHQSIFSLPIMVASLSWLLICFIQYKSWSKYPNYTILLLCFVCLLLPTSSFISINELWNERRQYAVNFYLIYAVLGLTSFLYLKNLKFLIGLAIVISLIFGMLTLKRNPDFLTEYSYWKTAVESSPSERSYTNYAVSLQARGDPQTALVYLSQAEKNCQNCKIVKLNLVRLLFQITPINYQRIEAILNEEIRKSPFDIDYLLERSDFYLSTEQFELALQDLLLTKKIDPKNTQVYFKLANTYLYLNDLEKSKLYFELFKKTDSKQFKKVILKTMRIFRKDPLNQLKFDFLSSLIEDNP